MGGPGSIGGCPYGARSRGEEGVVATEADIVARPELGAALTHEDVAGEHVLAAELLHAEALAGGIAPVARGAA